MINSKKIKVRLTCLPLTYPGLPFLWPALTAPFIILIFVIQILKTKLNILGHFMKLAATLLTLSFLISPIRIIGQDHKILLALEIHEPIHIDGKLNEPEWDKAEVAQGFVQIEPRTGQPASYDTQVKVLFDDKAIYIGAYMLDPSPDSLSVELGSRDEIGMADYFGVRIDPFNDGLNAFGFYVTCRGVQADMRIDTDGDTDFTWDAVWRSSVSRHDTGWSAELMIPYSALRFPRNGVTNWGLNFIRSVQRFREHSFWNEVNPKVGGVLNQSGELSGVYVTKPPLRLSGTPYMAAYATHYSETAHWKFSYNYGLDLKLGLSKSFTLDLTLIPDFGHVDSDELIHSLSPFEVYYDEKRPFFTEGVELFSKGGNIFYSRRIGAEPSGYRQVIKDYEQDAIIQNPETAQLINAVKLSGKTSGGLGVGVFNAITSNTHAIVEDSAGLRKEILTEPFTNFNMTMLDQSLKNNSYISLYNTNVTKPDLRESANVSGTELRLRNKRNTYEVNGLFNLSQHYTSDRAPLTGQRYYVSLARISGNFLGDAWFSLITDTYDPNDLGFQYRNDQIAQGINLRYNIYEPKGRLLRAYNRIYINHYYHYINGIFTIIELGGDFRLTNRNHLTYGGNANFNPLGYRDFYEARVTGLEYYRPPSFSLGFWWSPDYRKSFLIDYRFGIRHSAQYNQFNWNASATPRWRISTNLLLRPELKLDYQLNNIGYVKDSLSPSHGQEVIFGRRDVKNVTTSISADYTFTPNTSLAFRMRHYWLRVDYLKFYDLLKEGKIIENDYSTTEDFIVNAFNVDMVFKWDFAPGSELLLIWKNAVYHNAVSYLIENNYFTNWRDTFQSPVHNSLSIKLLYYLDWQYFRRS